MNRIEAFECGRFGVYSKYHGEREILVTIKRCKVAYLRHFMRNQKLELLQLIAQRKIEAKRGIGRKHISLRNIRN